MEDSKPTFIIREASTADKDYVLWLSEVKERVRQYGDLSQKKSHQLGDLLEMPDIFGMIPWRHHVHIVSKATSLEEAIYYVLELGQGFAFVGRQKELRMPDGTSFFPDLLFYHIPQKRYLVVDLKAVKYVPEFAGKINFYVTAVDKLLRGESDNPTVGLIICKSYDKTIVEWSLQDISKPLGVAAYQLQEVVERTVAELELKAKGRK